MRDMTARLEAEPEIAVAYRRAHESFLAERDAIESLGTDFSWRRDARSRQMPARPDRAFAGQGTGTEPVRR